MPDNRDIEADIVVVGFGAAGVAASVTACEPGADVVILEKAPEGREGGTPIPRLYSAGELGSIYSYLYQGTGNIGECLAFGRIAAREAVAETVWG
ncbi:MAG: FAD-binding protein [Alphaproteobacteria bacterium]